MLITKVSFEIKEDIAYIGFNFVGDKTLLDAVASIKKSEDLKGVIFFSHSEEIFFDNNNDYLALEELNSFEDAYAYSSEVQNIFNEVEDLKIPTLACVNGKCNGLGSELILCCDTILASDSKKTEFGFCGLQLGLSPYGGGTYRLPKVVGLKNAIDLLLTGREIDSNEALQLKLADEIVPYRKCLSIAPKFFSRKRRKRFIYQPLKETVKQIVIENFLTQRIVIQNAKEQVLVNGHYLVYAQKKIIETLEDNTSKRRYSSLNSEAKTFATLLFSEQFKNLRIAVKLLHEKRKLVYDEKNELRPINRGAVIGATLTGGEISWLMAENQLWPYLIESNIESLQKGVGIISKIFEQELQLNDEKKHRSIMPKLDYKCLSQIDLVVESVTGDEVLKEQLLNYAEEHMKEKGILASSSSIVNISQIAKKLNRPENYLGMHFVRSVFDSDLVEIIKHDSSEQNAIDSLCKWCFEIGKVPIVVSDSPGFLFFRLLIPYLNEAVYLLEEGIDQITIDQACLSFGLPKGPLQLMDEIGLDVIQDIGDQLYKKIGERYKIPSVVSNSIAAGTLGKKSGEGFYTYYGEDDIDANEKMTEFVENIDRNKAVDEVEIQKRLIIPMMNEASLLLEEGIISSPFDVDLALNKGLGFPQIEGGLLRYADRMGLDNILKTLQEYAENICSIRFKPSDIMAKMVAQNTSFYEKFPQVALEESDESDESDEDVKSVA